MTAIYDLTLSSIHLPMLHVNISQCRDQFFIEPSIDSLILTGQDQAIMNKNRSNRFIL